MAGEAAEARVVEPTARDNATVMKLSVVASTNVRQCMSNPPQWPGLLPTL